MITAALSIFVVVIGRSHFESKSQSTQDAGNQPILIEMSLLLMVLRRFQIGRLKYSPLNCKGDTISTIVLFSSGGGDGNEM